MHQEDIDNKLRAAMVKMHVYERDHNRVSFTHTKEILQMIFELAPIDEKDLKSMLRISSGIDKRYINQYLDGFRVWGVIFREAGMIYTEKPLRYREEKEPIEAPQQKEGKCKYDIEKQGTCEHRGIIKNKKTCASCKEIILLD